MSLAFQKLQPVQIQDAILNVDSLHQAPVMQGASITSWQSFAANSVSPNNISWSVVPPSGVVVDRKVKMQLPIRLILTGRVVTTNVALNTPTALCNPGFDAPRQFPIASLIQSVNCQLNNDTFPVNCGDSFSGLIKYCNTRDLQTRENSTTPAYPDQALTLNSLIGTSRNSLGNFGNSSADIQRGSYPVTYVSNPTVVPSVGAGTSTTTTIDFCPIEDLGISPFFFYSSIQQDSQGFWGLNNINVALSMYQGLGGKAWSHSTAAVVTSGADTIKTYIDSIQIQFNNFATPFSYPEATPTLQFKFLTPSLLQKPPLLLSGTYNYPYWDVNQQTTTFGTIPYAATGSVQKVTNSFTLSSIPSSVFIGVKPSSATLQNSCQYADSALTIEGISITFGNQNAILNGCTKAQLYDICLKNGLQGCSWEQFSGQQIQSSVFGQTFAGCGAFLKLDFSQDIYLPSNEAAGMSNGNFQFQATVNVANRDASLSLDNVPMECYCVFITNGSMVYSNGQISHQVGIISAEDVLNAAQLPNLDSRNFRMDQSISGGSFLDTLSNFGNKIHDFLKQSKLISTIAHGVAPVVPFLGPVAAKTIENLGYGEGGYSIGPGGSMVGGRALHRGAHKSLMYR